MVPEILVEVVEEYKHIMPTQDILELFEIPRSTYYRWEKLSSSPMELSTNEQLVIDKCKETRPLEKLVSDITYLPWGESSLYLSSIMDLYNGEIIAYTIGPKQDVSFTRKY